MEQEGNTFMSKQKGNVRKSYAGPIISAILMTVLMIWIIWLILWGVASDPADAPPLLLTMLLVGIPVAVIIGVGIAMIQRLKEIRSGEEDDVGKY